MKSVLISIQPKWCELIASGKKTIEVRKTRPKIDTPFKCYIYQTKMHWVYSLLQELGLYQGKVIGEFVCDRIDRIRKRGVHENYDYCYLSLNVFGNDDVAIEITDIENSCIPQEELNSYGFYSHCLYAWHISDLVIYDKPKELSEFITVDKEAIKQCEHRERVYQNPDYVNGAWLFGGYVCNKGEIDWCCDCKRKPLKRPPQSWCYVENDFKE